MSPEDQVIYFEGAAKHGTLADCLWDVISDPMLCARGDHEGHAKAAIQRALDAAAADPKVHAKNGGVYASWTLAKEYGFRDIDGRQPDWAAYVSRSVNEILDRGVQDPGERLWVTSWHDQLRDDPRWKILTNRIACELDL